MTKIEGGTVRRRKGTPPKKNVTVTKPSIPGTVKPGVPEYLRGVFFGPPKTGKTTAACGTADEPTLLLSFDPDGHATETLYGRDNVTAVPIESEKHLEEVIKALHAGAVVDYPWVVADSLTFLFDMIGGKDIAKMWKNNKDVRRLYGNTGGAVNQYLHDLMVLKTNLILTAHLEKEDDNDGEGIVMDTELGESEVKVAITPMVWKYVGPGVSFIGRTFKKNAYDTEVVDGKKRRNKRTLYAVSFNDGERSPAGSRLRMSGEYEVTPSWLAELAATLKGEN